MTYWLDGIFQEKANAINIADRGFLLGDGVFETLLVDRGAPAFLDEHLMRMHSGLAALRIDAAIPNDLCSIIRALAIKNGIEKTTASARITISRGASGRGLTFPASGEARPTVLITLTAAPAFADTSPARLIVSHYIRAEQSAAARYKTLNYIDNILARHEAKKSRADEAVMLNTRGRVACATSANIFVVTDLGAATPPVEEGALPGVIRGVLLKAAANIDVCISERAVAIEELRAGVVVLTNSLIGLRPACCNGADPPTEAQTEIFNKLNAWYQNRLRTNLAARNAAR